MRLKAHPRLFKEEAADWVEFAAGVCKEGPFLQTQGQSMAWYQVNGLDVYVAAAAVVFACIWVKWRLTRWGLEQGQFWQGRKLVQGRVYGQAAAAAAAAGDGRSLVDVEVVLKGLVPSITKKGV
jgi:hypothetical protein